MMCQRVLSTVLSHLSKIKQTQIPTSRDSTFWSYRQKELWRTSEQEANLGMTDFQRNMVAAE